MDIKLFLQGLVIGFFIAMPVGPIGVLCIQRTLQYGRTAGLVSGVGAAVADGVHGSLAGLGVAAVTHWYRQEAGWLRIIGGLYLLYLGIRAWQARWVAAQTPPTRGSLLSLAATTFLLTLANPVAILAYVGVFAGLGVGVSKSTAGIITLVLGVCVGSMLWWTILATAVASLRERITPTHLRLLNRLSGLVLIGFALFLLFAPVAR